MQSIKSNIQTNDEPLFRSSVPATGYLFKAIANNLVAASVAFDNGTSIGIGTTSPIAKLHVESISEQLRIGYDVTRYLKAVVDLDGLTTFTSAGPIAGSYGFDFQGIFGASYINGAIQGTSSVDNVGVEFNWNNGVNGGGFQLNDVHSELSHTLAISLDAPAIGLYGAMPIARPTTAYGSATFVVGGGAGVNINDTFDGYKIGQVIKILRDRGDLT